LLKISRVLAVVFALGLGVGETIINWGHWQYAPLWIVDYLIVFWLLWAVWQTRNGQNVHHLLSAWAFTMGVFYIALFVSLDPENAANSQSDSSLLILMGLMLGISLIGFLGALLALNSQQANNRPQ
jgi:uncharacterized membrane protein